MYRIYFGPSQSRSVEATENMERAAELYSSLKNQNAMDISLQVEGMPIEPAALLRACRSHANGFLRSIT